MYVVGVQSLRKRRIYHLFSTDNSFLVLKCWPLNTLSWHKKMDSNFLYVSFKFHKNQSNNLFYSRLNLENIIVKNQNLIKLN